MLFIIDFNKLGSCKSVKNYAPSVLQGTNGSSADFAQVVEARQEFWRSPGQGPTSSTYCVVLS